jgi:L-ornithine N5-monooxygenase
MPTKQVYDLAGIGYGPSNIALNISLSELLEENTGLKYRYKFFERKDSFNWHGGMLMPDTYLQVSFLKDMVTQRNPRSRYTFINFLYETGRLNKFINLSQFEPSRIEFNEYLKWVSKELEADIEYHSEVKKVTPNMGEGGTVDSLTLSIDNTKTNKTETWHTRNLIIASGGKPSMPKQNKRDPRVVHCSNFLDSMEGLQNNKNDKHRFAVVGGGQSAVEMILYLHNHFPHAEIHTIISGFAFQQADTSLFVNEVFMNEHVDSYFYGNARIKEDLFSKKTNYAVTSQRELEALYRIFYTQSFHNEKRVHFANFTTVKNVEVKDHTVTLHIQDLKTEACSTEDFDHVFMGTGFERNKLECLDSLNEYFVFHESKIEAKHRREYEVNRDYSIKTTGQFKPKIFVQGHSEMQHGITNTLLSVSAVRAGEITQSLMDCYDPIEIPIPGENRSMSTI